jgi:membrane peptidoglycan carboxypeptidase
VGRGRGRRRVVGRILAIVLVYCGAGTAAAEAYVDSVPLPGTAAQPQASVLYYRDGRTILARVGTTDHTDVQLSAVPPPVRRAVLAAEDRGFYGHAGVSLRGVARALVADARGGRQGASTITQQYVRNAYLSQDFSVDRKAREFALAVKLERQLSKDEILERYLDTVYFGRGAYGIAAAAHAYFGILPERLTLGQGAVLAAVIKDPWGFDPAVDPAAARSRWRWIVTAMAGLGWADRPALAAYPAVAPRVAPGSGAGGLVVDRVERELAARGVTPQTLHTQGLSVVTTLDPVAQRAALAAAGTALRGQPRGLRAALVAVDPQTGGVRAYYGGDLGRGFYDEAAAAHPAASTFKPIVLAAALREGIGYESRWDGSSPRLFPGRDGVPLVNHDGLQCPSCTLEQSMVQSLNTPFYAVTERIGADRVRRTAVDLGIPDRYDGRPSLADGKGEPSPGRTRSDIAIGRYPVTVGDLASVYATFAAGGLRAQRHFVETVTRADGRRVLASRPAAARVLDPRIAADVSAVLGAVVAHNGITPGRPAAGKTGTQQWGDTHDNQDAWMAGYTPQLATAVWLGRSVPGPIRDAAGRPIQGETLPARAWRDFLAGALHGDPPAPLPEPAHVGRTDVGDAGRAHDVANPDAVAAPREAADGYRPVVHTRYGFRRIALTLDDGPSRYTGEVLDILAANHVKATFCTVGEMAQAYPATVRRIVAEGHRLCNHSMHHDDLGGLAPAKVRADLEATDRAIAEAAPGAVVTYYRAPYGDFGQSAKVGAELGHTPLGWLVDPDDWRMPGTQTIVSRILAQITPRAVVLVHDGGGDRQQTVDALRILIPELRRQGWSFDFPEVTVRPQEQATGSPAPSTAATPPSSAPPTAVPPPTALPAPSEPD